MEAGSAWLDSACNMITLYIDSRRERAFRRARVLGLWDLESACNMITLYIDYYLIGNVILYFSLISFSFFNIDLI